MTVDPTAVAAMVRAIGAAIGQRSQHEHGQENYRSYGIAIPSLTGDDRVFPHKNLDAWITRTAKEQKDAEFPSGSAAVGVANLITSGSEVVDDFWFPGSGFETLHNGLRQEMSSPDLTEATKTLYRCAVAAMDAVNKAFTEKLEAMG